MSTTIRPHIRADADAVADILAAGWQAAYAGFMPQALLAPRIDPTRRRAEIAAWFNDFDTEIEHLLVAESTPGAIAGFVHIVREDKADLGAAAHINLLYVDPARFGRGIGTTLMAAAADWLAARTSGAVVLSAYADNPYRAFYARLGGTVVLQKTIDFDGHALASIYYHWPSPQALRAAIDSSRSTAG
ncbi:GNAT family N-acetyltransferase [Devosia aquimaris]|uniref:GNAT family N-acetyltransferase n=1 Tax=Devosia aquimaris TaxID=2866214 RepID=UPI001CD0F827|nr:GNAT family N-acetyltransferase [Devosia sp. CJK-A8-3]